MVAVFREVRRVLKDDGVLWLNLGDSYSQSGKGGNPEGSEWTGFVGNKDREKTAKHRPTNAKDIGLKPKDLVGIPWRVAFALQADGWYLRSDIIWSKPNPMPESVTDRPTKAHEYIFLMSKSAKYYYDAGAIAEESISGDNRKPYAPGQIDARGNGHDRGGGMPRGKALTSPRHDGNAWNENNGRGFVPTSSARNKRTVWNIPTFPYPGSHFATFPEEIPRLCILAGSRPGDVVLDPFGGSGCTAMVALKLGRKPVHIDLTYHNLAKQRMTTTPAMAGLM